MYRMQIHQLVKPNLKRQNSQKNVLSSLFNTKLLVSLWTSFLCSVFSQHILVSLLLIWVLFPLPSASTLHAALKDAKASHRPPGRQLSEAEVHGQRQPSARHRVAEGQSAAPGWAEWSGRRGRQEEEVDVESQERDARTEREVHVPCVQQGGGDQRHIQTGSHTWVIMQTQMYRCRSTQGDPGKWSPQLCNYRTCLLLEQ